MSKITTVAMVSQASLGYKSLQNDFFYLNEATIDTFGIEPRYLMEILELGDLNSESYLQSPVARLSLFYCNEPEDELRGTGALRYIRAVAHHAANRKKQAGKNETIEEALTKQGGELWYGPKAQPHKSHIWIRKAFDSVYAPFLFPQAAVVDQRCNFLIPNDGITWRELAAVLTSTLFTFSIEVNGAASLGAGALEAATKKLRAFPIVDVRALSERERQTLVSRAKLVWERAKPVNWSTTTAPDSWLRQLDEWLLALLGMPVTLQQLYTDMCEACRSRIAVAGDKDRTARKKRADDIDSVADGISSSFRKLIEAKRFPEGFFKGSDAAIAINLPANETLGVRAERLLGDCHLEIQGGSGQVLIESHFPGPVADLMLQALMLGRRSFHAPSSGRVAAEVLEEFYLWFGEIHKRIRKAVNDSSVGTGFEDVLEKAIWTRLGLHSKAGRGDPPRRITLTRREAD